MLLTTDVEWHDLEVDGEDLPSANEDVIVTIETLDGERRCWNNVFYDEDAECWCTFAQNEYGQFEKTMVWYKVVGWAYLPNPMPDTSWRRVAG